MQPQKRVSENAYEELKMLRATGEVCELQFNAATGGVVIEETKIADVFEDADGQYLLAENGLTLHLHQLIAINGKPLEHFC